MNPGSFFVAFLLNVQVLMPVLVATTMTAAAHDGSTTATTATMLSSHSTRHMARRRGLQQQNITSTTTSITTTTTTDDDDDDIVVGLDDDDDSINKEDFNATPQIKTHRYFNGTISNKTSSSTFSIGLPTEQEPADWNEIVIAVFAIAAVVLCAITMQRRRRWNNSTYTEIPTTTLEV